jgi:hypothetical protein
MGYLDPLLPAVPSLLLGISIVVYLTTYPRRIWLAIASCILSIALIAIAFYGIPRGIELLIAIPLSILLFIVGYTAATIKVLSREDKRDIPELTRSIDDPGDGHDAVVYFTHGEPEYYDPIGWINQFREFDEQGIKFVPLPIRPFFLYALRKDYIEEGKSNHREIHFKMLDRLEEEFRKEGDENTRFYLAFLDDNPRPDVKVIEALNDGASRVIVSEVFLTVSNHTAEGEHLIKKLDLDRHFDIRYTGPLYDSETLMKSFVVKAQQEIGDLEKSKVGILLVGHGQPDEWDVEFPTETDQEIGFREDVLDKLEEDGYKKENLSLAWMRFKDPVPSVKIEEFVGNGVEKVIYFCAAISADSLHSQCDIPKLVEKAQVPVDLPVVNLGAWNDHPQVILAIKEKIESTMRPQ